MADIDLAFTFVMRNEDSTLSGQVSPEPKGAKARFGVNSAAHPEAIIDGFYEMDKDKALDYAKNVFTKSYWQPILGDQITNQIVANKFVDLAFNLSPQAATKIMQRAINRVVSMITVFVDGQMGPKTLVALNATDPDKLMEQIRSYATQYYQDIAYKNEDLRKYLEGWLRRVDV